MEKSGFDRLLDYFPLLAYLGFYIQGALVGAIITGDPRLMKLGFVTLPAVIALIIATARIRGKHNAREAEEKRQ